MHSHDNSAPLQILLAEDERDDRYFFKKAIEGLTVPVKLTIVENGRLLMDRLSDKTATLPDIVFMDNVMPGKTGLQCLEQMRATPRLRKIPVIMYSMLVPQIVAEVIYRKGARFYLAKLGQKRLEQDLSYVLDLYITGGFRGSTKTCFMIDSGVPLAPVGWIRPALYS